MRDCGGNQRLLHAVLEILLPEILAVDQLDGKPKPAMPGMIVRLKNADAMAGRRGKWMKKRLGLAAISIFPKRKVAIRIDKCDGLAKVVLKAHENRISAQSG